MEFIKKLMKDKKYDDALAKIDEKLKDVVEYIELLDYKATILEEQNKTTEAFELLKKAITYFFATKEDIAAINHLRNICKSLNKNVYASTQEYYYNLLTMTNKNWDGYIVSLQKDLRTFIEKDDFANLAKLAVMRWYTVEACIYTNYLEKNNIECRELKELIFDFFNSKLLYNEIKNEDNSYVLVCNKDEDIIKYNHLAYCLSEMCTEVIIVLPPMVCEMDSDDYDIDSLNNVTFENMQQSDNVKKFIPIKLMFEDRELIDTTQSLLLYINDNIIKDEKVWLMLGDTQYLRKTYCENIPLRKRMQIFNRNTEQFDSILRAPIIVSFLFGSYLKAVEKMYLQEFPKCTKKRPAISVIIPTRGSPYTLEYTLKTCLNQKDFFDYEIVVSDNSDEHDKRTYDLIQKINNPKIKYFKTHYPLPLVKSFEFAYLKAEGEFLISLGADDALMPYALKVISKTLIDFPDIDILMWKRLLYIWPNFIYYGEEGRFMLFINNYIDDIYVKKHNTTELLSSALNDIDNVYNLPTCYINSGMKRKNLDNFINYTGKLLDGMSQDLYTAALNCAIHKEVYSIELPLTIAGMSSASIGAMSQMLVIDNNLGKNTLLFQNFGSETETKVITLGDLFHFDVMLTRVKEYGIRDLGLKLIDYEKEWLDCIYMLPNRKETNTLIYTIKCALRYYDKRLFKEFFTALNDYNENFKKIVHTKKSYPKGIISEEYLVIDSSEFGIKNICEAVDFFVNLYSIYI